MSPGKHVVFGRVIKGFEEVVLPLAEVPVDGKDRPTVPILITNCGELEFKERKGTSAVPLSLVQSTSK
jgi:peptidyl-prolyl isomerase G (cyclophilin G)